jgi:multicomponent Na+:H+ antiporter subunit C
MLALVYRTWWLAQLGAEGDIIGDEEDVEEDAEETAGLIRSTADDDRALQDVLDASDEEVRR